MLAAGVSEVLGVTELLILGSGRPAIVCLSLWSQAMTKGLSSTVKPWRCSETSRTNKRPGRISPELCF